MSPELLGVSVLELRTDQSGLDKGLAQAERKTALSGGRMAASMDRQMLSMGKSMGRVGSSMTRNLTLPILAVGGAAADLEMKFAATMERLHTQAGASQKAVGELSKAILNMAGSVGTSPQQLADGMYHVVSSLDATLPAATKVATELKVLRIAAEGAKIGNANLVDVTNGLDAAVVSGIKGVQNYSQAMGALNAIVGAGDMTMQNLAEALGTGLLAPMKTYGLTLKDVGGALAVFGDNNIRGSDAATKLASAVRLMAAPSHAAAKELGTIGLTTLQLADDMRTGGLIKALSDLRKHLQDSGMTASQQGLVIARAFGGRQSAGVQVLLHQLDRLKAKTEDVGAGAKNFGRDWAATQQTAAFKTQAALATIKADLTRFGEDVLPTLLKLGSTVVRDVDKVAHAFASLPKGLQQTIIKGGLLVATIGPAMKVLGVFTTGVGRLFQLAKLLGGLTGFGKTLGGTASGVGRLSSMVGTMEVGTLIARSMVGGPGGAPGVPPIAGAGGAAAEEAALARAAARLTTLIAAGSISGILGYAAASHAAPGALNQLNAMVHGMDPTNVLHLVGLPSLTDLLPTVKKPIDAARATPVITPGKYTRRRDGTVTFTPPVYGVRPTGSGGAVDGRSPQAQPGGGPGFHFNTESVEQANKDFLRMNNELAKLEQHKQGIRATAYNLDWLAQQAKKAGDVKWQFADSLGAELLRSRNVASRGAQTIIAQLGKLPPGARNQARQAMISMARELENMGRLPRGSTTKLVVEMLADYQHMRDKGGVDFKGLMSDTTQTMDALRHRIATSTGKQRQEALAEYAQLRAGTANLFKQMAGDTANKQQKITAAIQSGSHTAAIQGGRNFSSYSDSVFQAMKSGLISSQEGAKDLTIALNATLKAFGSKPIPGASLGVALAQGFQANRWTFTGKERGGLVQFGAPGARGRDNIPVNFGGVPIMVGAGEKGAVFTGEQQAIADYLLGPVGGLQGLFSTYSRPHYAARGGGIGRRRFAQGGIVSYGQLEGLWDKAGGNPKMAALMAAIAEAESGGNVMAHNPSGASGLWQIMMPGNAGYVPGGAGNVYDPLDNAIAAVRILASQGLGAWETYTSGAYRGFLHGGVPPGALGALGAAFKPITAPKVSGTGTVPDLVRAALGKEAKAANAYAQAHMPVASAGAGVGGGAPFKHGRYTFPLPAGSWTSGRIDQGWDLSAPAHTPEFAIGPGVIVGHGIGGFGPWAPILRLDQSIGGGSVYYGHAGPGGELPIGTHVRAGQVLGEIGAGIVGISTGPHLEIGWYPPGGSTAGASMKNALGFRRGGFVGGRGFAQGGMVGGYGSGRPPRKARRTPKQKQHHVRPRTHSRTGAPRVDRTAKRISTLLGAVPALQDRYDYTSRFDDLTDFTFVVTSDPLTGQPVAPYIDTAAVSMRAGELSQLYGWQEQIRRDLQRVAKLVGPLLRHIKRLLAQRRQQVKQLHKRIQRNLVMIKKLSSSKSQADKDMVRKLKDENQTLGGDRDKIGTGGQIAPLERQIKALSSVQATLTQDQTDTVGPSGIGGTLGDTKLTQLELTKQIGELSPQTLAITLKQAQGGYTSPDSSLLSDLLTTTEQELAVSQAQYSVLANFPPFGGSFADGGIVPGPPGAARTIIAHGGERVGNDDGPNVRVIVEDNRVRVLVDDVEQTVRRVTRGQSRGAMRASRLPGASGSRT